MADQQHDGRQVLGDRVKSLEDEFFRREDQRLMERLRELKAKEVSRDGLSKASGITNPGILDKLLALGIRPEIVGALAIIPLVEVAWADGAIGGGEKRAILDRAQKAGIESGSPGHDLLASWLERRPEPKLLTSWIHMVQGICESLGRDEVEALRAGLVERAGTVARASGGLLGVGSVSTAEAEKIKQLESAFRRS